VLGEECQRGGQQAWLCAAAERKHACAVLISEGSGRPTCTEALQLLVAVSGSGLTSVCCCATLLSAAASSSNSTNTDTRSGQQCTSTHLSTAL
jgi:hypothetical protein